LIGPDAWYTFFIVEAGLTMFLEPLQKLVEGGVKHLAFTGYFPARINFSLIQFHVQFHGLPSAA